MATHQESCSRLGQKSSRKSELRRNMLAPRLLYATQFFGVNALILILR